MNKVEWTITYIRKQKGFTVKGETCNLNKSHCLVGKEKWVFKIVYKNKDRRLTEWQKSKGKQKDR